MKRSVFVLVFLLIFIPFLSSTSVRAEDTQPSGTRNESFAVANGDIYKSILSPDGSLLYIGGSFTQVGPYAGNAVMVNSNGTWDATMPKVNGTVYSIIDDGAGGWYIGGAFTKVGTTSITGVAHILADKTVDPDWTTNASLFYYNVYALALSGNNLYVGGNFQITIGGVTRNKLMALDTSTGLITSWNPAPDDLVRSLLVDGNTLYVGGQFTSLSSTTRRRLGSFAIDTGTLTAWNPNPTYYASQAGKAVYTLVLSGSTLYVGGNFSSLGGSTRAGVGSIDVTGGNALASSWNPNINGGLAAVYSMALSGSTLYVGGSFSAVNLTSRVGLAAIDTSSGSATSWNPAFSGSANAVTIVGDNLYIGGVYTSIAGQTRYYLSQFSISTGNITSWDPHASKGVYTILPAGTSVYVGGELNSMGSSTRDRVAAINTSTGAVTAWAPSVGTTGSSVVGLAACGTNVYIAGAFSTAGGESRNKLAALDATTGLATSWNPNPDSSPAVLLCNDSVVYAGGGFATIGGQSRIGLAALDATTGLATSWNPNPDYDVESLLLSGTTLYVGGYFTNMGGQVRNSLAAFNTTTGSLTDWNPSADEYSDVYDMALSGNTLYAAGSFTSIGGATRNRLAAIDTTTGLATSWHPNVNSTVKAVAVSGSNVYFGGAFTTVAGALRQKLGIVDAGTGLITSWTVTANNTVNTISLASNRVYVGGLFTDNLLAYDISGSSPSPTPTPSSTPTPSPSTASSTTSTESSSSNSNSVSTSTPECGDSKPSSVPDLFQINMNGTTATLFFTPVENASSYYISFSTHPNAEEHGAAPNLSRVGVQTYNINHLKPQTVYYFKVRASNGCMPGEWSKTMLVKSSGALSSRLTSYYKNAVPMALSSNSSRNRSLNPSPQPVVGGVETVAVPQIVATPAPQAEISKKCFLWWCW